jgi:phosphoribosylanthranilate isomerase
MAPTRIKICGITREEDALAAVEAGADAIGLVFYPPSPRSVTAAQAAPLAAAAGPFVTVVGLFVDASPAEIEATLAQVPLDVLQFQGGESPPECARYRRPWIKALQVREGVDLPAACAAYRDARAVLLDSWHEDVPGGTGRVFDWSLAPDERPLPLILAGGLNAENVGDAIRQVRPAAVDVSSGVESVPGIKDALEIARYVDAVRVADRALDGSGCEHEQ